MLLSSRLLIFGKTLRIFFFAIEFLFEKRPYKQKANPPNNDDSLSPRSLNNKKKKVLIPKSDFNNTTMKSFLLNDNTVLKKNNYGITEPINNEEFLGRIDVIFIPLVAYDLIGNRVGYGKGFYDKFLRNQNNKILRVGLSFFNPEKRIKIDEHDENLDFCVTPNRIFSFQEKNFY